MHFVIVKSEQAVRSENQRLAAENDRLRAEVNRLRALVGEPLEEIQAHAQPQTQHVPASNAPLQISMAGPQSVQISRPKAPAMAFSMAQAPVQQAPAQAMQHAMVPPAVQANELAPAEVAAQDVQAFTAGECRVQIGRLDRPAAINPQIAAARGQVAAQPQAAVQAPRPAIAQPQQGAERAAVPVARRITSQEDLDDTAARFGLIELT